MRRLTLGKGALFGRQRFTLAQLAERLAAPALVAARLVPLSELATLALVTRALSSVRPQRLGRYRDLAQFRIEIDVRAVLVRDGAGILGIVTKYDLIADTGRHDATGNDADKHMWRVPTLRNVGPERGFPKAYMHNGYFKSLKAVVHFYNTRDVKPVCTGDYNDGEALAAGCWPVPEVPRSARQKFVARWIR